jgi:hypothetical protein
MANLGPKCALLVVTKNSRLFAAKKRRPELLVHKHTAKSTYDCHSSLLQDGLNFSIYAETRSE